MRVGTSSIICIVIAMLAGVIVPVLLFFLIPKKSNGTRKAFWVGCGVMFLFALTLESYFHRFVNGTEIGKIIWDNALFYALYGGFAAGIFEETGRLLAFRFVLKKEQDEDGNALTYAAGHAGFEMFAILFFTMLNNLIYATVMAHPDKMEQVNGLATAEQAEQIQAVYEQLAITPAWMYLVSIAERGSAILLQFSLTVLVWFAVKKGGKKIALYFLAILLHAASDGGAVLIHKYTGNAILTEVAIFIFAVIICIIAFSVWKKERSQVSAIK